VSAATAGLVGDASAGGSAVPLDDSSADVRARSPGAGDDRWPDYDPASGGDATTAPGRATPDQGVRAQISSDEGTAPSDRLARAQIGREGGAGQPAAGQPGWPARLWDPATLLIAASVVAAYTVISVFRYLRRDPTSWDLGIFTEYVKQYAHLQAPIVDIRGAGFDLLGDHFHPIVALIAPFFWLFPTSVTLLVAQALLAGVSVLPVSQLGRELLGNAAGRSIATAYGLSWGLQQMANYDFHEIAFAVPLLAFSLTAVVRGRTRAAVLWALPLVFVKEDQGFTVLAIGLILAFAYRRQGAGLLLEGWGLLWSLLAITVIIPLFNPQHSYHYWAEAGAFSPVGGNFSVGALWSTLSDGAAAKLPTLAMILLPTAFIALRSPVVLAAVPSLALRAINTNPSYWGTAWHYNATVMPIVFIAAIDAMARIRARRLGEAGQSARSAGWVSAGRAEPGRPRSRLIAGLGTAAEHYGAAAMVAICAALAFQFPLSSLWAPATYALGPHVAAENRALALVPNGASVSTDLDLLAPLASRTDTYWLGNASTNPATRYVVFDTQSTDCTAWEAVCLSARPATVLPFVESLAHGARYQQIYDSNGVFVFRRIS
jgi:uncharacterized membrane protein